VAKTACIVPGFLEGQLTAWRMRRELHRRGYTIVSDQLEADIIIAHSGGLFFVYPHKDKQILLIDPLTNVENVRSDILHHIWYDIRHIAVKEPGYYIVKTLLNLTYIWNLPRWIEMSARAPKARDLIDAHNKSTTIITASNDQSYTLRDDVPGAILIDADHDDCWRNPSKYLDLLQ